LHTVPSGPTTQRPQMVTPVTTDRSCCVSWGYDFQQQTLLVFNKVYEMNVFAYRKQSLSTVDLTEWSMLFYYL
jgi:hypothetical protein